MIERVGFVGLGFIGEPMAARLCERFETAVCDLRSEAVEALVKKGGKPAASPREVAQRSQVVGVCVVDDAGTEAVVAGEDGLLSGAGEGAIVAIHGTVHPDTVRRLAAEAEARGVTLLDAQMTGGPARAVEGGLRFFVGGPAEAFERARPFLAAMGDELIHCGALGLGAVAKLCNNLVQYGFWQAVVDGVALAEGTGLGAEKLQEVLSWILNDNTRVMLAGRSALVKDPGNEFLLQRFTDVMHLAEKDLALALEVGRAAEVALPVTGLNAQLCARMYGVPDPKRR